MSEGRSTERDPVTGKFVKAALDSETAAEMGKRSHKKRNITSANVLLAEDGFDDDNPAPEHLRILAEYAVSGKAGSVAALRDYRRLTRKDAAATDVAKPVKPTPGSVCPLCDELVMTDFRPSPEQLDAANDFIEWDNERRRNWLPKMKEGETEPDPETGNPFSKTNGE